MSESIIGFCSAGDEEKFQDLGAFLPRAHQHHTFMCGKRFGAHLVPPLKWGGPVFLLGFLSERQRDAVVTTHDSTPRRPWKRIWFYSLDLCCHRRT